MKLSRVLALGPAIALTFALAGCGDDGDDDKAATPLTAEEFKEQVDKICADANKEISGLEPADDASEADIDAAYRKVGDLIEAEADKISDLTPPEDLVAEVEEMLDALKDGADVIQDKGAAIMQESTDPLADASEKAKALGLEVCGQ